MSDALVNDHDIHARMLTTAIYPYKIRRYVHKVEVSTFSISRKSEHVRDGETDGRTGVQRLIRQPREGRITMP